MKTTKKKTEKKFDFERTQEITAVISTLSQFIPRVDGESPIAPLFSKEFLLKNLLGLTEEEYKLNDELLQKECENILTVIGTIAKQYQQVEQPEGTVKQLTIKTKEKVN
jgi:hypothetical protein